MILAQETHDLAPMPLEVMLDSTVIRIVEMADGIKDTALTIAALTEIVCHPEFELSTDQTKAAMAVAKTIHRLIHSGRLVAVDCETPNGGFTFVLPAHSRPSIALPIFITDNRTRH